jgi:hypothetical protein
MSDFCPFMSSGEKKVACDPDCNLYMRENNGIKNPWNGKPMLGCAITKNLYMTYKLQEDISALKVTYTKADGTKVDALSTLDRGLVQAIGKTQGSPILYTKSLA